jgi:preprotein translocase subunit SecF
VNALSRTYAGRQDVDFPTWSKRTLVVSIVLLLVSVVALVTRGLDLSIDFEGGSSWEVPSQDFGRSDAEAVLDRFEAAQGARFQEATTADGSRVLRISGQVDQVQVGAEVADALAEAAGVEPGEVTVTTIGPSWGEDITRQATQSLIWFMVLIGVYLAWRLEPKMAFAALCAVVHDIVVTLGIYALFQIEVTPATVIAFLTILGYSLYDTVVVFDRLHDGVLRHGKSGQYTYSMIMRRTLNQTLMRCVNTSVTTILPIMGMLVVGGIVFDQPLLSDFSLALVIGLLLGVYSSMFVAAPIVVLLKEREQRWRDVRERLRSRGLDPDDTSWPDDHKGPLGDAAPAAAAARPAPRAGEAPPLGVKVGGHPPRPRKSRKR